jgi:hypothetical protein
LLDVGWRVLQQRRAEPSGALRAIDATARPRSWWTAMRAAYGGNPAPALATTHGGAAAVTAGSAPAGQQVEQHQPDSHQSKEDEQIPHDVHCDSSTAHREGGHRLRHQQASGGGGPRSAARRLRNPSSKGRSLDPRPAAAGAAAAAGCRPAPAGDASSTPAPARWHSAWPAPHPHGPTGDPGLPRAGHADRHELLSRYSWCG